jgi:hypothetical protein
MNACFWGDCVAKLSLRRLAIRDSVGWREHQREQRMMGRREEGQGQFFYSFDLDKVVPPDHLVRQIDGLLDLSWVHRVVYYRASKSDCSQRSLKPRCTTAIVRKITRDLKEDVRDRVRALADTEAFQQSRRERKKVEMRFAHMKRILRLDRFRLRGLSGVRDEVLLTATAQNLRRLARLLCRAPPPLGAACLG